MKLQVIDLVGFIKMSLSPHCFTEGKLLTFRNPLHSNLSIVFGTVVNFLIDFVSMKQFSEGNRIIRLNIK